MSCRKGRNSLSQALRHVFLPVLPLQPVPVIRTVTAKRNIFQARQPPPRRQPAPAAKSAPVDPRSFGPARLSKITKDEDIQSNVVCVVDEKGQIGQPQFKRNVLNSMDRKDFFLVQVQNDGTGPPVCKITSRDRVYTQERLANSTPKQQKDKKEVEIPWKAADGDIDHKMKIARDFLEEGKKVDIVLIARRPREIVTVPAAAQAVVDRVLARITEIEGIKETLDPESIMGKSVTIHLEGPKKQKIKKAKNERTAKEIEMIWGITDEELEKKKFRISELLASNIPVDLVVTSKRKAFAIPEEEGDKILRKIWSEISRIPGVQELEPREGKTGETVTLFLGKASPKREVQSSEKL